MPRVGASGVTLDSIIMEPRGRFGTTLRYAEIGWEASPGQIPVWLKFAVAVARRPAVDVHAAVARTKIKGPEAMRMTPTAPGLSFRNQFSE